MYYAVAMPWSSYRRLRYLELERKCEVGLSFLRRQHPETPAKCLKFHHQHCHAEAKQRANAKCVTMSKSTPVDRGKSKEGSQEMNNQTVPAPASCCRRPLSRALAVALAATVVAVCHDHAFVSAATAGGGAPSVGAMRRLSFKHDAVRPALSPSRLGFRRRIGNLSAIAAAREKISAASCVEVGGTTCGSNAKAPSSVPSYLLSVRGGGLDDDYYDDEYDEDSDYDFDDDDDFAFDEDDMDAAEDDFGEGGMTARLLAAYEKTPPFTKAYLTASAAVSALGYVTNGNQFPSIFLLDWKSVLTKLQIWRPFTAFLNIGPMGLGYAMTAQFVWTYMATLERMNHSHPYDFWLMIFFGCASMVAGYSFLKIPPTFLGHNLSTFLVYVWSRYHEGVEVSMFELFNARAEMLPWLFLAQTFLLEGVFPTLDLLGILFGHIYHHLWTTNALKAPKFVINWYNGDSAMGTALREKYKTISSDFEMEGQ